MLVDHSEALLPAELGVAEGPLGTVQLDRAGIWLQEATDDVHQSGFARAVLPENGVDFTGTKLDCHVP